MVLSVVLIDKLHWICFSSVLQYVIFTIAYYMIIPVQKVISDIDIGLWWWLCSLIILKNLYVLVLHIKISCIHFRESFPHGQKLPSSNVPVSHMGPIPKWVHSSYRNPVLDHFIIQNPGQRQPVSLTVKLSRLA